MNIAKHALTGYNESDASDAHCGCAIAKGAASGWLQLLQLEEASRLGNTWIGRWLRECGCSEKKEACSSMAARWKKRKKVVESGGGKDRS